MSARCHGTLAASARTHPLRVQVSWAPLGVEEVTVLSGVVNTVQLALPHKQIGLSKRPSLCHGQSIKLAPYFDKLVICLLEPGIDLPLARLI